MNETISGVVMTLKEIEEQYDGEYILVEAPELDRNKEVVKGKVFCHSKKRDDVDSLRLRPKRSSFLYTAPIPDNIFINL